MARMIITEREREEECEGGSEREREIEDFTMKMNSMKIMFMAVLMVNMYVCFVQQKQKFKKIHTAK